MAVTSDAGGLNRMMEMVNGSRFGVAMMGLGIARRSFLEAAIWAHHRPAKGRLLVDLPLAREQLVDVLVELEAALALGFECAAASRRDDGTRLRRILVPAAKVRLCRLGVEASSFAIELHGGNGYCEDWGLTRQLRDAQCHPIWEGSENICALDVLRAIRRDAAHEAVLARVDRCLEAAAGAPPFAAEAHRRRGRGPGPARGPHRRPAHPRPRRGRGGRRPAHRPAGGDLSGALLLEQAAGDPRKALVALRYARRHLAPRDVWDDRIAAEAGRELLAHDDVNEERAAKAAA